MNLSANKCKLPELHIGNKTARIPIIQGGMGATVLACRPARLKVLVPEMPVMTLAAISGDRVAVGMCFLPWKIRSEWISSETTST